MFEKRKLQLREGTSLRGREFRPFPLLKSGHAQTVAAVYLPQREDRSSPESHVLPLSDGDAIVAMENTPALWSEGDRIVVLIHGLTGCYLSNYMVRLREKFEAAGVKVLRINQRGCGPGFQFARKPYHCGRSEDVRSILKWLMVRHPKSPVTVMGFSLGASMVLNMAGEDGAQVAGNIDSLIAVSPPIDLNDCAEHLMLPKNRVFNYYFVQRLLKDVRRRESFFKDFQRFHFPKFMSLPEFDDLYTAPLSGFRDGKEYYAQASSFPRLSSIQVPTLILVSEDDPIIDICKFEQIPKSPFLNLVTTSHGGHVGFIGQGYNGISFRWMDSLILQWALGENR